MKTTHHRSAAYGVLFALFLAMPLAQGLAQDAGGEHAAQMKAEFIRRFKAADQRGDGKLTREEAKAGMPLVNQHFDEIDADKKGYVTIEDIAAWAQRARAGKQGVVQ